MAKTCGVDQAAQALEWLEALGCWAKLTLLLLDSVQGQQVKHPWLALRLPLSAAIVALDIAFTTAAHAPRPQYRARNNPST
jgi:hypothetical protein